MFILFLLIFHTWNILTPVQFRVNCLHMCLLQHYMLICRYMCLRPRLKKEKLVSLRATWNKSRLRNTPVSLPQIPKHPCQRFSVSNKGPQNQRHNTIYKIKLTYFNKTITIQKLPQNKDKYLFLNIKGLLLPYCMIQNSVSNFSEGC